jgi:internalin A
MNRIGLPCVLCTLLHFRNAVRAVPLAAVLIVGCSKPSSPAASGTSGKSRGEVRPPQLVKDNQQQVVTAEFENSRITRAAIADLKEHTTLKTVTFYECEPIDADALTELAKLDGVHSLDFIRTPIDDDGIARLSGGRFAELSLAHTKVSAKGLATLKSWKHLSSLKLKGGRPGNDDLSGITALTGIQRLELSGAGLDTARLAALRNLTSLESLSFGSEELTELQLADLPALPALRRLQFAAKQLTDKAVPQFLRFPRLRRLNLSNSKITDQGLEKLSAMNELEILVLDGCKGVTNDGMLAVATLPKLQHLSITDSGVHGAGLKLLASARNLKHVTLAWAQASASEVKQFTGALPTCEVERVKISP